MEIEFVPAPIYKRGGKGFKVSKKYQYLSQQASQIYRETGFYKGGDFAVLELESELYLEDYFGSFGYNFTPREYEFKKVYNNMQVLGYPIRSQLVEYRGQVVSGKYFFLSSMPIEEGVNGAPLVLKDNQGFQIIGLHTQSIRGSAVNFSVARKLNGKTFL